MELVLEVVSSEQYLLGDNARKTFFAAGGVIGRSSDCDWVIPDQNRHLSGRHGVISFDGGAFYIEDISTNGVFVNDRSVPMDKHQAVPLAHQDLIVMGEIEFRVSIELGADSGVHKLQRHYGEPLSIVDSQPVPQGILDPLALIQQKIPAKAAPVDQGEFDNWYQQSKSMPDALPAEKEMFDIPNMLPEDWNVENEPERVHEEIIPSISGQVEKDEKPRITVFQSEPVKSRDSDLNVAEKKPNEMMGVQPLGVSQNTDNLIAAFCKGLGIPVDQLEQIAPEVLMERAGAALSAGFAGVTRVMRSRATLKNAFRMDRTLIQTGNNNPFKLAVNNQQLIKHFVQTEQESYLSVVDALEEAYCDIEEHQVAVMTAMQASLNQLLDKMSPTILEKKFDKNIAGAFSLSGKQRRYWEAYKRYHDDILEEPDIFEVLLGNTFNQTYKTKIEQLKQAKSTIKAEGECHENE